MNVLVGVAAGLVTSGLLWFLGYLKRRFWKQRFAQLFGRDSMLGSPAYAFVYSEFYLPLPPHVERLYAYDKRIRRQGTPPSKVSIESPVSSCEVRPVNYLATLFGAEVGRAPAVLSDIALDTRRDMSMIAFGSPGSNNKSFDIAHSDSNQLLACSGGRFACQNHPDDFLCRTGDTDIGFILKLIPDGLPERTWIMCAGIGEWGTSGAAWYLSHRWRVLAERFRGSAFCAVVRVTDGQDESASLIAQASDKDELDRQLAEAEVARKTVPTNGSSHRV